MKKILLTIIISLTGLSAFAQGEFDALKYNQTDINGTARFMGMAGAFGALGGDATAISLNPAGLGVYRSSEFSITSGVVNTKTNSTMDDISSTDSRYRVPLNNMTYIINFGGNSEKKSGIVNSNFAISYNKMKNFNRNVNIQGAPNGTPGSSMTQYLADFTDGLTMGDLTYVDSTGYEPFNEYYIPWMSILAFETFLIDTVGGNDNWETILNPGEAVTPYYTLSETGYINEWAFSYAANISNKIYIGASLGIQDIDYSATSTYSENFADGGGFTLSNHFRTYGSGINFKFGTILRPFDFLRIGAAVSTPTFFALNDEYSGSIYSTTTQDYSMNTPQGGSSYKIQGPLQCNASVALVGKLGIVSVDYGFTNYTSMILRDADNLSSGFTDENLGMKQYLLDNHSLKVGAELKLSENFALRAGWGMVTPATDVNARKLMPLNTTRTDPEYFLDQNTSYYSGGLGYREGNWFFDFAYMLRNCNQDYYAYNLPNAPKASVNTITNNFIATLGFKF